MIIVYSQVFCTVKSTMLILIIKTTYCLFYVIGHSMRNMIDNYLLDFDYCINILKQMLEVICYLHEKGVVHNDITRKYTTINILMK